MQAGRRLAGARERQDPARDRGMHDPRRIPESVGIARDLRGS